MVVLVGSALCVGKLSHLLDLLAGGRAATSVGNGRRALLGSKAFESGSKLSKLRALQALREAGGPGVTKTQGICWELDLETGT